MAIGNLQTEADLERFVTGVLDGLGLTLPGLGLKDGGIAKSKLGTDALDAFLKLAAAADLKLAHGSQAMTWSASTSAGAQNVTHGLGATPLRVFTNPGSVPFAAGVLVNCKCTSKGASTFTLNAEASSAQTGSVTFDWVAIG